MFEELTIIDLGGGIAPAFCTKLFADLGADVVKVEPPGGDSLRRCAPFAGGQPDPEKSLTFAYANTSKRGITLDVTTRRGRELLLRLVAGADVVVEGHAPSWLEGHGLDFDSLRVASERLIMTSITPFGQDGPWRDYAGNDFLAQHASGVAYNNGSKVPDLEAQPPFPLPGNAAEFLGGLAAASATMCALIGRELTGEGTHIDVALQEALAMHLHLDLAWTTFAGTPISRATGAQPAIAYVSQQPCADGYIDFVIRTEEQWQNFLDVLGNPDWGENPLFATGAGRAQYWDALEPLVQGELRKHPKAELYEKSQARGVPAAPVSTLADAANEDHFADREAFVEQEHPAIGTLRAPGQPVRFGAEGWQARPAPALGEHNREIYVNRLGLSDAELATLAAEGVV